MHPPIAARGWQSSIHLSKAQKPSISTRQPLFAGSQFWTHHGHHWKVGVLLYCFPTASGVFGIFMALALVIPPRLCRHDNTLLCMAISATMCQHQLNQV